MTIDYVVGFAFSELNTKVLLIRKNRPLWQKGKLNGIGGHIEKGEQPVVSMIREFKEETTIETKIGDWYLFSILRSGDYQVFFFWSILKISYTEPLVQPTDEKIGWYGIDELIKGFYSCIPNLKWLIPMAINMRSREETCRYFNIIEE